MADRWGTSSNGGKGKAVWFEIDTPAAAGARGATAGPVRLKGLAGEAPPKGRRRGVDQARLKMAV
jgi:hypothetical protein